MFQVVAQANNYWCVHLLHICCYIKWALQEAIYIHY